MKKYYDEAFPVYGIPKSTDWIGWTDGVSLITGVNIPFRTLRYATKKKITARDVIFELRREFVPYGKEAQITFIPTPMASAIVDLDGIVQSYVSLDYYDIMFNFGLNRTHYITFGDSARVHVYNLDYKFVGFFSILKHRIWSELLELNIDVNTVSTKFRRGIDD